jgi:minor extracellular serine protease Vpr
MTKLLVMLAIFGVFSSATAREARLGGHVQLNENRAAISKENFRKAADYCKGTSGIKKVRVLALVDSTFNPSELAQYGWTLQSRVTSDIVTIEGPAETAKFLSIINGLRYSKLPERVFPQMDSARKLSHIDEIHGAGISNLPKQYNGDGVLIGIMETEFDTRHQAFLDSTGKSRFVAIWDQKDSTGPKNSYNLGTIKNRAEIMADSMFALNSHIHGTWITGMAAGSRVGSNPYYGVAPNASLVGVCYTGEDNDLVNGIKWIFSVADSLKMPCVINMSIGTQVGPHDGTSIIDKAIDNLSGSGKIIVGAAGNDGSNRVHAKFVLNRNETRGTWITPESYTEKGMEKRIAGLDVWGKSGIYYTASFRIIDKKTMVYQVIQPSITTSVDKSYGDTLYVSDSVSGRTDTVFFYALAERRNTLNSKVHIQALAISKNPDMMLGVNFSHSSTSVDTLHVWNTYKKSLESLDLAGFSGGDSLFSVNEVGGTSKRNITVGAYNNRLVILKWDGSIHGSDEDYFHRITHYSSHGPTVDGRIKPDICAPGSEVVGPLSRAGDTSNIVIWPDVTSNSNRYSFTGGTSVSAPIVTGVVALMLQAKPSITPEEAKQVLISTAYKDNGTGALSSADNIWGAGKLNALGALQSITGVTRNEIAAKTDEFNFSIRTLRNSIILSASFAGTIKPELLWYTLNGKLIASHYVDIDKEIPVPQSAAQVMILKVKAQRCEKTFLLQK